MNPDDETTEPTPQPCGCGLPHLDGYRVPGTGAVCPFYPWEEDRLGAPLYRRRREGRELTIDLDTGDWINPHVAIQGDDGARVAASVLPGWPAEEIQQAYLAWQTGEPEPGLPVAVFTKADMELAWPEGTLAHESGPQGEPVEYRNGAWRYTKATSDRAPLSGAFLPYTGLVLPSAEPATPAEDATLPTTIESLEQLLLAWPVGTKGRDRDGDKVECGPNVRPHQGHAWRYLKSAISGADAKRFLPITDLALPEAKPTEED